MGDHGKNLNAKMPSKANKINFKGAPRTPHESKFIVRLKAGNSYDLRTASSAPSTARLCHSGQDDGVVIDTTKVPFPV